MVRFQILFLAAALYKLASASVDLGGHKMGLASVNTCGKGTISCSALDDDWPDQGMSCPEADRDIPRHAIAIVSVFRIQLGKGDEITWDQFPHNDCYTTRPNPNDYRFWKYNQGTYTIWYFTKDRCECSADTTPNCRADAQPGQRCAETTFTMCKTTKPRPFTKEPTLCLPRHGDGWVPVVDESAHQASSGSSWQPANEEEVNPTNGQLPAINPNEELSFKFMDEPEEKSMWNVLGFFAGILGR